ncbi:MAG: aldehyde dehydrogenase (NADP(+)) [Cyclobacteriaceae bacterium]
MKKTTFNTTNPTTGEKLPGEYVSSIAEEVDAVVESAVDAFSVLSKTSGEERAILLESIAEEIEALGDGLVEMATSETGLPAGRIQGERGRTVGQLRLFASVAREGSWVEASIDQAIPDRQPLPKSDLRKMLISLGPVAVFGASNFPLAFSTAGGDTASALAAGCPVVVKAHEAHLGTHSLISKAIHAAVEKCNMPTGVYGSVIGGIDVGQELVKHAGIKAVGFTGSRRGGMALHALASARPEPIPVYAEMSSINPVVMLPDAVRKNGEKLAENLAGSIVLGAGQFCTNPGLILGIEGNELNQFATQLAGGIKASVGGVMLTKHINETYQRGTSEAEAQQDVQVLGKGQKAEGACAGIPVVAKTTGKNFLSNPKLHEEIFGPYSLIVSCDDEDELANVMMGLEGQLTATFMCSDDEIGEYDHLVTIAEQKVGRVIFNGVPTGVEVCHSMVHGGPFPSTSDAKFTSVGADAIKRFARPVCYQDAPSNILPMELQNDNPLNIWRKVDGALCKDKL